MRAGTIRALAWKNPALRLSIGLSWIFKCFSGKSAIKDVACVHYSYTNQRMNWEKKVKRLNVWSHVLWVDLYEFYISFHWSVFWQLEDMRVAGFMWQKNSGGEWTAVMVICGAPWWILTFICCSAVFNRRPDDSEDILLSIPLWSPTRKEYIHFGSSKVLIPRWNPPLVSRSVSLPNSCVVHPDFSIDEKWTKISTCALFNFESSSRRRCQLVGIHFSSVGSQNTVAARRLEPVWGRLVDVLLQI